MSAKPERNTPGHKAQPAVAEPAKPGFIGMVEPTLVEHPPTGERWVHEIKWDGWRAQAHLNLGKATIYTRRGYDWTTRFKAVAVALATLPARSAILDGEVVANRRRGAARLPCCPKRRGEARLQGLRPAVAGW